MCLTHIQKCTHTAIMIVANQTKKATVVSVIFSNCHASVDVVTGKIVILLF